MVFGDPQLQLGLLFRPKPYKPNLSVLCPVRSCVNTVEWVFPRETIFQTQSCTLEWISLGWRPLEDEFHAAYHNFIMSGLTNPLIVSRDKGHLQSTASCSSADFAAMLANSFPRTWVMANILITSAQNRLFRLRGLRGRPELTRPRDQLRKLKGKGRKSGWEAC